MLALLLQDLRELELDDVGLDLRLQELRLDELGELERENRQLRLDNEFLGKAAAFFAKDRR